MIHTSRSQSNGQVRKGTHTKGAHRSNGGGRSDLIPFDHVETKAVIEVVHTSWVIGVIADAIRTRICDNGRIDLWSSTSKSQLESSSSLPSFSHSFKHLLVFCFSSAP